MSEFKGTPGKWAAFDHGVGDIVVFTDSDQSAVCVFDGDCVAWPSSNYQTDGTAMANAHLIAAAPNLLEELEETDKTLCALQGNIADANKAEPRWDGMWDEIQQRRDAVKAVIDAATKQP